MVALSSTKPPQSIEPIVNRNVEEFRNTVEKIVENATQQNTVSIKSQQTSHPSFLNIVLLIFINNVRVDNGIILPFFGTVFYFFVLLINAYVGGAVIGPNTWTVLLMPHAYIEFLAYSIAFVESTNFNVQFVKSMLRRELKKNINTMLWDLLFANGISWSVLFTAAIIETTAIIPI
jgi:hypothetical protein